MPGQIPAPLFTTKFNHGKRSFFFDVKKTKQDKPYLKITASSLKGEEKQRAYLTIFDTELQEFCQAVSEAAGFISTKA
ncbi:MAG TPA: DUF3276 family protein [Candidatus Binatia bacterium]|nr:DUF3276 family protein [Candidatus Binatia bacterium]